MISLSSLVLLTGGTGFIGARLTNILIDKGFRVAILTRKPEKVKQSSRLHAYYCDLSQDNVKIALKDIKEEIGYLIYLASDIKSKALMDVNISKSMAINIRNFINILQYFEGSKPRVIYASSYMVYPRFHQQVWTEKLNLDSSNLYGIQKNIAELFLEVINQATSISAVSLRISSVYGPGMKNTLTIPRWIHKAKLCEPIVIMGDASQEVNYIYIDDVVEAILKVMNSNDSGIYNIASEHSTSLLQLAETIREVVGNNIPIIVDDQSIHPQCCLKCQVDTTKIYEILNFKPKVRLKDGISYMMEEY